MISKKRKNRKLDKTTKKILILIGIIFLIMLTSSIINTFLDKKENNNITNNQPKTSIEQILERYGCKYIKNDKNIIYLNFKYNTFEKEESNQRYYENIINELSNFLNSDFILIDETKNLKIEIKKYTNNEMQNIYVYTINGTEDYFENEQTKLNLKNIDEDKNTNLIVNNETLQKLVESKWNKDLVNFGSKETTYNKYDIYFDEGIEVRTISRKVYNIIFTKKFNNYVINGISPGATFEQIISILGEPTYGAIDKEYIGYKNEKMYVFFTENEISIYKNENAEMKEFYQNLKKYVDSQINIKEFMNELTYIWSDYEEYTYNSSLIYINYPTKGIRIKMDTNTPLGITIYKNCNLTDDIFNLIKDEKISENIKQDLVELTFKEKIKKDEKYIDIAKKREEETNYYTSNLYYLYYTIDKNGLGDVSFISKDDYRPNKQLNETINQGFFINDEIFIYSIKNKGIYALNVTSNQKNELVTGQEEFNIIEFKENILKYDDKEIKLVME